MSLTGSRFSSDSAPRPFHHGDSKTRWNNLSGGLAVSMTAGPSGQTISPHSSSREGHHSTVRWISDFSPIWFDPAQFSSYCDFPSPPERGAVNPHAMHDHGQATREAAPLCAASDFGVPSSLHFNCCLLMYGGSGRHAFRNSGKTEGQGRASKILSPRSHCARHSGICFSFPFIETGFNAGT